MCHAVLPMVLPVLPVRRAARRWYGVGLARRGTRGSRLWADGPRSVLARVTELSPDRVFCDRARILAYTMLCVGVFARAARLDLATRGRLERRRQPRPTYATQFQAIPVDLIYLEITLTD
jgi:hypothetical protein